MTSKDGIQVFVNFLHTQIPLEDEERAFLESLLNIEMPKKGDFVLRQGEVSRSFYFNVTGLVRLFYHREGVDTTAFFYDEGSFISSYESFIHEKPSPHGFQALENSLLIEIGKEAAAKLLQFSPKFEALARIGMEQELIMNQKVIGNLLTLNPENRYKQLLTDMPSIFQRIPQHFIASYIGVKPESLSRIKRRFQQRNDNQSQ